MNIGILSLHLLIPGCSSLKEKRSHIRPITQRLHREFNISAAEIELQDQWQEAVIACSIVSSSKIYSEQTLQKVIRFTEKTWPDIYILNHKIEFL